MKMLLISVLCTLPFFCGAQVKISQYEVYELALRSNNYTVKDNPVRDVLLLTQWLHESGKSITVYGFYDGDGKGKFAGNVFKVRFTPTEKGKWELVNVMSNDTRLNNQKAGLVIECETSNHPGFWVVDPSISGGRWYKRSNGTYPYIVGNTMYSFLTERGANGPHNSTIERDVTESGKYFNKLRFGITGDRYPHPVEKPFIDADGNPTDDGNWSHRPNPKWFLERVDKAVKVSYDNDIIADIILNGPDTPDSRSNLLAKHNNYDAAPFLRYMAARYGSYPNVWFCMTNEFDIRDPRYTPTQISFFGQNLRSFMGYPSPLSVHGLSDRNPELNTIPSWDDHVIVQYKLKELNDAADKGCQNYFLGGAQMPVFIDELAYEGAGDGWSRDDVIESFLGAFLGGAYASTGYKSGNKLGQYFEGKFSAEEHTAADNLLWMRKVIDNKITFRKMQPVQVTEQGLFKVSIFREMNPSFRVMAWPGYEYVLGTNKKDRVIADLPEGSWTVTYYDIINKRIKVVSEDAKGQFRDNAPDSRAVLWHFKKNQ